MNINILGKFNMKQSEQPLYPKLSSIYNKILQLVSAVLLILVLMSIWLSSTQKNERVVTSHFKQVGDKFLQQTIAGVSALQLVGSNKKNNAALLQAYLNKIADADFIKYVHLYDETGQLLLQNESTQQSRSTVKALYGIDENYKTLDKSKQYVPFVSEIRTNELTGFLRLTIEKSYLTQQLSQENNDKQGLFRLSLILAGLVGFLLTRGLNRYSRQGFRMPITSKESNL
jgi:Uncharacterized membrane protein affecting hemolysin expression